MFGLGSDRADALARRLARLEQKVNLILQKLGLPEQDDLTAQVMEVLRRDGKIPAIKYYREQSGAGLPEAKDFVESLE